jgi:hypothetical protein
LIAQQSGLAARQAHQDAEEHADAYRACVRFPDTPGCGVILAAPPAPPPKLDAPPTALSNDMRGQIQ